MENRRIRRIFYKSFFLFIHNDPGVNVFLMNLPLLLYRIATIIILS